MTWATPNLSPELLLRAYRAAQRAPTWLSDHEFSRLVATLCDYLAARRREGQAVEDVEIAAIVAVRIELFAAERGAGPFAGKLDFDWGKRLAWVGDDIADERFAGAYRVREEPPRDPELRAQLEGAVELARLGLRLGRQLGEARRDDGMSLMRGRGGRPGRALRVTALLGDLPPTVESLKRLLAEDRGAQVARCGVSRRTVQRLLADLGELLARAGHTASHIGQNSRLNLVRLRGAQIG